MRTCASRRTWKGKSMDTMDRLAVGIFALTLIFVSLMTMNYAANLSYTAERIEASIKLMERRCGDKN